MPLLFSIAPIVLLIWMMTKRNGVPSYLALPLTAAVVYAVQLLWFDASLRLLHANIITALVSTLTPITIIAGAILLNKLMQVSGAENVVRRWLETISPNPVAQLMIIGWAFAFMIEGASGFGTPAAIAAPILVGLGFNPLRVALLTLVMNSVPVSFGAVGTPQFGFANLGLSDTSLLEIGRQTALIHFVAGFVIPLLALRFIVSRQDIRRNLPFILLSVLSCTVPYLLLAQVNYEFPALVGGAIGFGAIGAVGTLRHRPRPQRQIAERRAGGAVLAGGQGHDPDPAADCYSDSDARPSAGPEGAAQQHRAAVAGKARLARGAAHQPGADRRTAAGAGHLRRRRLQNAVCPGADPFLLVVLLCIPLFRLNGGGCGKCSAKPAGALRGPLLRCSARW